jgi:hypothetical protein
MTDPLTPGAAMAESAFSLYRKKTLTSISDRTYPPGTVYETPEGLRAEDEETRCAFDAQGHIYPIRESVFRATYAPEPGRLPTRLVCPLCGGGDHSGHTMADGSCAALDYVHDVSCSCSLRYSASWSVDGDTVRTGG